MGIVTSILIIEDDLEWEPLWNSIFHEVGIDFKYTWTTSGQEAQRIIDTAMLKGEMFDLIILDIFLSGSLTAFDLLSKYGASFRKRMLFVSSVEPKLYENYFSSGEEAPKFLKKPFGKIDGARVVRHLLSTSGSVKLPASANEAIHKLRGAYGAR